MARRPGIHNISSRKSRKTSPAPAKPAAASASLEDELGLKDEADIDAIFTPDTLKSLANYVGEMVAGMTQVLAIKLDENSAQLKAIMAGVEKLILLATARNAIAQKSYDSDVILAAALQAAIAAKPNSAPEPEKSPRKKAQCNHDNLTTVAGNPKLAHCDRCGTVVSAADLPAERPWNPKPVPADETPARPVVVVDETKKSAAAPVVSFDDLRSAAVAFAGKKGKPALIELLKKYTEAGTLASIPEEKRAALLVNLKEA